MVLENPFPPDIRVEKELRALEAQGHEVSLLCGHKDNQPTEERFGKTRVSRFQVGTGSNKVIRKLEVLYYWFTARKRPWEIAIRRFVEKNHIQALHVHDLPLVPAGLVAARQYQIPLIFDMHEIYPIMIRARVTSPTGIRGRVNTWLHSALFSPRWWDRVEQRAVEQSDKIIVVVEESKDRLQRLRINSDKISVVLNAEDIDQFLAFSELHTVASEYRNDFVVGYVGGVDSPNRGLDILVRAWPLVLQRIHNARLLVVGDGGLRPAIEQLVRDLDLTERVTFTGWVPFEEVAAYIKALDLAVIPHVIDEHTNHTIPHKLFQYIALGKLVVASDIVPIRRVLEDTKAGIIVDNQTPASFADAITNAHALLRSNKHSPEHQVAVLKSRYGFHAVSGPLLKLYEDLENSRHAY
jgi:glycosyltransferase involved in cell wall biosynthesis